MSASFASDLVQEHAWLSRSEFGHSVPRRWKVSERLVNDVRAAVESEQLAPRDAGRLIAAITATLVRQNA